MKYRVPACGSGVAALGGLDAIAFSGKYTYLGQQLGDFLRPRLSFRGGLNGQDVPCLRLREGLERLIADEATTALLQRKDSAA
jgi:hypothetical protein